MIAIKEMIIHLISYSVLASCCLQLIPSKKYGQWAETAIGLGYICMILDYGKQLLETGI
ncbi:MAG: hypothetical protein IJ079_10365 [Lachnospiraceae bacterium]|nr:hypothetical protein [Lachnospiraceae bacterium]